MTPEQLAEMTTIIAGVLAPEGATEATRQQATEISEALTAAGFVKADHIEYAANHRHSGVDVVDEDGDLWADRYEFEEHYEEYGSVTLLQRSVSPWIPLEAAE